MNHRYTVTITRLGAGAEPTTIRVRQPDARAAFGRAMARTYKGYSWWSQDVGLKCLSHWQDASVTTYGQPVAADGNTLDVRTRVDVRR